MRNLFNSSSLCSRILRGLALGCFCLSIFLFSSPVAVIAAETGEPEEMETIEEMEEIGDGIVAGTVAGLAGDIVDSDSGEAGQTTPESEVEDETVQVGCTCAETLISFLSEESAQSEEITIYENLAEFEASSVLVDRYQYELLKRLEFLQYSQVIMIGLIFVLIFKKK